MATLGFIGTGNMGGALARAACKVLPSDQIFLSNRTLSKAQILAEELSRRDMNYPEITEENYEEIMGRMQQYMEVFQISGVDRLMLESE